MTNDQRMVDVGLLEVLTKAFSQQVRAFRNTTTGEVKHVLLSSECDDPSWEDVVVLPDVSNEDQDKLRAIISGPGVEPVGMFVRKGLDNYPSLEWQKNYVAKDGDRFYLAAPSAPVQERGPWRARVTGEEHPRTFIESDDFTHDVRLYVDGDFADKEQRMAYAQEISRRLNQHNAPVQAAPVAYHDKDQPEGIAWCPGYPEKLEDISPLYTQAPVQAVQEAVEKLKARDKTLRELRGKYPVQAVPDWQPIETAPKDGTEILAADSEVEGGFMQVVAYDALYSAPWRTQEDYGYRERAFTHWMPRPQPPKEIGE